MSVRCGEDCGNRIPCPKMCLDVAGQVASGIAEIHSHDLVHLDIHAGNIFIDGVLVAQACLCIWAP